MDITDLRKLLSPEELKGKRAQQKAAQDARGLIKKDWLSAQLTHYGLEHDAKMTVNELRNLLENAVKSGRVSK